MTRGSGLCPQSARILNVAGGGPGGVESQRSYLETVCSKHERVMVWLNQNLSQLPPLGPPGAATYSPSGLGGVRGLGLELHSEMGWVWVGEGSGASDRASHSLPRPGAASRAPGPGVPAGPHLRLTQLCGGCALWGFVGSLPPPHGGAPPPPGRCRARGAQGPLMRGWGCVERFVGSGLVQGCGGVGTLAGWGRPGGGPTTERK